MKSIKIAVLPEGSNTKRQFKVISIKNSISYIPGEILREEQVHVLCNSPAWDVTTVDQRSA